MHDGTEPNLSEMIRMADASYGDGNGALAGQDRASAREISNTVFAQDEGSGNEAGLSNMFWMWGQFLDHDITLTVPQKGEDGEQAPIAVTAGDPYFDPAGTGTQTISFTRSDYQSGTNETGARVQMNAVTPEIDGSNVYGSDPARLAALRNEDGTMKVSGGDLLPFNESGLENEPSDSARFYVAGDVRANENVALLSLHTIFVREHNRLVEALATSDPSLTGDEKFKLARAEVEAQMQRITYEEFLPKLIGADALGADEGYDTCIDTQMTTEFSTAAFRIGHTMLPTTIARRAEDGAESKFGDLSLAEAFFRPDRLAREGGVDDIFRGSAMTYAEEVDTHLVDDVRNFLFGPPGAGGFDLAALNIQRGRDHGLPDFNTMRVALGLDPVETFAEITSDLETQARLEEAYGSVDDMDLIVAGFAEDPAGDGVVGKTFQIIIADQFTRLRDGDETFDRVGSTDDTLADIIARNTGVDALQSDVFNAADRSVGTDADDIIFSADDGIISLGGAGNDVLIGRNGVVGDTLSGGTGNDQLFGGDGGDKLIGGEGDDHLVGEGGNDHLVGGSGNDFLTGNDDDDRLDGGAGDDVIEGGRGNDTFVVSAGDDVILDFNVWTDRLDFGVVQQNAVSSQQFDEGLLITVADATLWLAGVDAVHDVDFGFEDDLVA